MEAEESASLPRRNKEGRRRDDGGDHQDDDPIRTFGDCMKAKEVTACRIISSNINGFTKRNRSAMEKSKNKLLRDIIQHSQMDVLLTQEDNIFWPKTYSENRPRERCKGWTRDLRVESAFNTDPREASGKHLQGGTSVYLFDEVANKSGSKGVDQTLLGRWSWIQVKGRDDTKTRIYSVYRPCRGAGEKSVYSQQVRGLLAKGDLRCPQEAFWEDLQAEVQAAMDGGDKIVIGGDFNCDMTSARPKEFMDELGLVNPVFEMHGTEGPSTYARGSKQIDGIMLSSTLQATNAGYLPLICAVGDHRPIWVDISVDTMFGACTQGRLS